MKKVNYHTHTYRCMHAYGSDEEYVQAAIKAGIKVLGFSDHTPWSYGSNFVAHMRMHKDDFHEYYTSIKALKEKYRDQIEIKIGLECEYFKRYMPWLIQLCKQYELDYIILGNHYYLSDEFRVYFGSVCYDDEYLVKYVDEIIEGLKTGYFTYLAHPDLFMRGRNKFDEFAKKQSLRLLRACKELNIPIEYNLEGARVGYEYNQPSYPHPKFWDLASEVGNDVIIGYDAHNPRSLLEDRYYNEAIEELKKRRLNILEEVELKGFHF